MSPGLLSYQLNCVYYALRQCMSQFICHTYRPVLEYFARLFYALNTFETEGLLGVASQMWDINMVDIPMVTKKQSVNWFNVISTPLGQPAPNFTMFCIVLSS
jgi:hypothetical protein